MHRSGTSALASAVEALGISAGDPRGLMPGDEHNENGYFEQVEVVALNDEILAHLGGSALEPPDFPIEWRDDTFLVAAVGRIHDLLARLFGGERFVLKDPRISVLWPLWHQALGEDVVLVYVVRDPWEVAMSLQRRDDMQLVTGVATWVAYNEALEQDMAGARVHGVVYDELLEDPQRHLSELGASLRAWGQIDGEPDVDLAAGRVDVRLHRNVVSDPPTGDADLAAAVAALQERYAGWRGPHESFSTTSVALPWWADALLVERRTALATQRRLEEDVQTLRSGFAELEGEYHAVRAHLDRLRQHPLVKPLVAARRGLRRIAGGVRGE